MEARAQKRYSLRGSKDKKYINVYGAAHDCSKHGVIIKELSEAGFEPLAKGGNTKKAPAKKTKKKADVCRESTYAILSGIFCNTQRLHQVTVHPPGHALIPCPNSNFSKALRSSLI